MAITVSNYKDDATNGTVTATLTQDGSVAASWLPLGFYPRTVTMERTDAAGNKIEWYDGMTSATAIQTAAAGTRTLVASNGITPVYGNEAALSGVAVATSAPVSGGPGILIGTSALTASSTVRLVAVK